MTGERFKRTTLSAFIVKQCRKLALFPNENTTVLSHGDELQVLQLCLASQKERNGEQFEASSNAAVKLVDKIREVAALNIMETLLKTALPENSIVAVISPESSSVVSFTGGSQHLSTCLPAGINRVNNTMTYVEETDRSEDEIQSIQADSTNLKEGQISENDIYTDHSSAMETAVLALFHEYKEISNHWTLMDAYSVFIKAAFDQKSDVYQAITTNDDVYRLEADMESCYTMQTKVIEFLQSICKPLCPTSSLQKEMVSTHVTEKVQLPSLGISHHALLLSPKTPVGKVKAALDSSGKSPKQASVTMTTPKTPFSPASGRGLKEIFIEDLFRSYMHLLVNSRSQLALARVFNIPDRGLDHNAFTHLKHEASTCGLSMYQTLSSFMLRINLGGQGYAPTKDHPLLAYVKGLDSLLDMTQKLQMIIEEVPELSVACVRVVNVIRTNLIRCKSGKFPIKLVGPVSEKIHDILSTIIQEMESVNGNGPDQAVSKESRLLGHQCLLVIQQFLDRTALSESQLDLLLMSDISFSSSTPTRFPCLLTQFRSPSIMDVAEKEDCENNAVNSRPTCAPGSRKQFVSAALCVDSEQSLELLLTQRTMNSIEMLPSKTIIHPRAEQESCKTTSANIDTSALSDVRNKIKKCIKSKRHKRPAASSCEKENLIGSPTLRAPEPKHKKERESSLNAVESPKTSKQKSSQDITASGSRKAGMSCRRRLLPQIKGQGKITGFFRM